MEKGTRVLLALMKLDIGGAETHVVELAKELSRRGFEVFVASGGGAYEAELASFGIKHFLVPLADKNPLNVFKAFKILKNIIVSEKIDIVHSHARIPSFILGKLHKKMKFPFVTSAHGVFSTKYGLKYITDWGQVTVSVSEDINKYLIDNYHIPEENIIMTINGIDTEKFSPDTDKAPACKEFGITDEDFVITHVSRLDNATSYAAEGLIRIVPKLLSKIPNLKILIAGGGENFENIKALAENVNLKTGNRIILAGPRTDISNIIAPANLFVGVSRAALEAFSSEKPVILGGNQGYIGLFDESLTELSIKTNFCCRGCEQISDDLLYEDILKYYSLSDDKKQELSKAGREIVKKIYSVSKMADDNIAAYDMVLRKKQPTGEILISGYYGFKNSGDDALLMSVICDLREKAESAKIVVLSKNPAETRKKYNIESVGRTNIFSIIYHLIKSKLLIFGGGTLIQDATSTKSLVYYLFLIMLARLSKTRVMLFANGIGPVSEKNRKITKKVLNHVSVITLRDEKSKAELSSLGVTKPYIKLTADPVFGLSCKNMVCNPQKYGLSADKKYIGISIRDFKTSDKDIEDKLADTLKAAYEKYGLLPAFVALSPKDEAISYSVFEKAGRLGTVISDNLSFSEIIPLISSFTINIGMRLHMLIYSTVCKTPAIALVYDPKVSGFMEYSGQKRLVSSEKLDCDALLSHIGDIMENYDAVCSELSGISEKMAALAKENAEIAKKLFEEGEI